MNRAELIDWCARNHKPLPDHFYDDKSPEVIEAIARYQAAPDPRDVRFELRLSLEEKRVAIELALLRGLSVVELFRSLLAVAVEAAE